MSTAAFPSTSVSKPAGAAPLRAARLAALPPFLFNEIDRKKREAIAAGRDVINLGVGDPDRPTPAFIVDAMAEALRRPANHQYPDCHGTKGFLAAAARFMERRFGVRCDPRRHVLACIGSKDGIAHLPLALLNPGDGAVVFTPAYPVYAAASVLAGAVVHRVPTRAESGWRPDFDRLPAHAAESRLMWLNFPGNPTGACADIDLLDRAVHFAASRGTVLASDLAYSEIHFGSTADVPSLWQAPAADLDRTHAVEFHSLSKTFNMTGWRIGFAVGHEDVIAALRQAKDNYDSGPFNAVQDAAEVALDRYDDPAIATMRAEYKIRRDLVVAGLRAAGCHADPPRAGIFVWSPCPSVAGDAGRRRMNSWEFADRLISEAAVVTVPGAGFSDEATDWFRVSLTRETERLREAMARLATLRF